MRFLFLVASLLAPSLLVYSPRGLASGGACERAHEANSAVPRTVMVQLFEWPWLDIARECETTLGPQGFSAVQISPPQEHLSVGKNNWWERYQPVSYRLRTRSGDEAQFGEMVRRCQAAGVDIYADVIVNHMAGFDSGRGFGGTLYEKYHHAGLYTRDDFHFCGRNGNNHIRDFSDRYEVQFCELLGLADLKTESPKVQGRLRDYMNALLAMGVKGFRLDATKHVPAADLAKMVTGLNAPAYIVSEIMVGLHETIQISEYLPLGDVNVFPYAWDMARAFWQNFTSSYIQSLASTLPPSETAVVFVENHDTQRALPRHTLSPKFEPHLYFLANVLMLTWPYGYPQVFSGYDFDDYDAGPPVDSDGLTLPILDRGNRCRSPWLCEHRRPGIAELVFFRNHTDSAFYASKVWTEGGERLAFSRGTLGFVAVNSKESPLHARIPTDLADGIYCNLLGPSGLSPMLCTQRVQVQAGRAQVDLPGFSALVLHQRLKVGEISQIPVAEKISSRRISP